MKRIVIMMVTILTPMSANAVGFNFNIDLGKLISSKLKAQTQYEMILPSDAVELRHSEAIKLYEDVAAVAYKKHWNIIIESPATSYGKKIYAVIENNQRNIALKKGKGNKFMIKQALSKLSKMKLVAGKEYKIVLRSKGFGTEL